eukprot:TRINITY_DN300_c0_g1_i1.p1 TRINITY_DN300_c0_g1~~TRINITY_DN300_c0_g1_i1.p1  ORF type:complete len:424 (-),score=105.17 TRINITY_DN300_c0_g1_i1:110-1360(-)
MSDTAHKTEDEVTEHFEDAETVGEKAKQLAEWIRESKHTIFFTGAGISTAAGIPDFRGPSGVWTLRAKGEKRKGKSTQSTKAIPTYTHMSLVGLQKAGYLQHLISQNTDGLHRKSGFPTDSLSELHGNTNLEVCDSCGHEYMRDFRVRNAKKVHNHKTGRKCRVDGCNGSLKDTIINFGENLPEKPLNDGFENSEKAELCIVLGSSLRVTPAADMPGTVAENGKRLVICNLQKTPYDSDAAMVVHTKCDDLMKLVMEELECDVPEWRLRRKVIVGHSVSKAKNEEGAAQFVRLYCKTVDADGTPASILNSATFVQPKQFGPQKKREVQKKEPFELKMYCPTNWDNDDATAELELEFMGHYNEPNVNIRLPIDPFARHRTANIVNLAYNPWERTWEMEYEGQDGEESDEGVSSSSNS